LALSGKVPFLRARDLSIRLPRLRNPFHLLALRLLFLARPLERRLKLRLEHPRLPLPHRALAARANKPGAETALRSALSRSRRLLSNLGLLFSTDVEAAFEKLSLVHHLSVLVDDDRTTLFIDLFCDVGLGLLLARVVFFRRRCRASLALVLGRLQDLGMSLLALVEKVLVERTHATRLVLLRLLLLPSLLFFLDSPVLLLLFLVRLRDELLLVRVLLALSLSLSRNLLLFGNQRIAFPHGSRLEQAFHVLGLPLGVLLCLLLLGLERLVHTVVVVDAWVELLGLLSVFLRCERAREVAKHGAFLLLGFTRGWMCRYCGLAPWFSAAALLSAGRGVEIEAA
ncbi:hypothetical protein CI238_07957, partial [Colletotrichum incanum]